MKLKTAAVLVGVGLFGFTGSVLAHHSFAMFDQEHPIELTGTVKEFKFTSPHTFILLEVKGQNETVVWNLEGGSPSALVRDGWSSKTLPPGTELKMSWSTSSRARRRRTSAPSVWAPSATKDCLRAINSSRREGRTRL